jgi:anti-sigma-K factor RskA
MTDWLGMLAPPRTPRSELKGRVLERALRPRRRWPLAVAAVLVVGGGTAGWRAYRTIDALTGERAQLTSRVAALEDTVSTFIHGASTELFQIPVSTGGRVGSVTIFADRVGHRWLVRCDGLAPNASDQAYQLWFITEAGMVTAAVMPMDQDRPMVMALEMPRGATRVMGVAMSIEPRAGSASPSGPVVFHRML